MHESKGNTKRFRYGGLVLVLEDDEGIAKNISQLFETKWRCTTEIAESKEKAEELVNDPKKKFKLGIIDTMVPGTECDLREIRNLEKQLKEVETVIMKVHNAKDDDAAKREQLPGARHRRSVILDQISKLIDRKGGIKFVRTLRGTGRSKNRNIPVLYLTALGNDEIVSEGLEASGVKSGWLRKPAPGEVILARAKELFAEKNY